MSIFDDPSIGTPEVDGIEVPSEKVAEMDLLEPNQGAISWPVVVRWCEDHPGQGRLFPGLYGGISSKLKPYKDRVVWRMCNYRPRHPDNPDHKGNVVDVLVMARNPDGSDPLEDVPGVAIRDIASRA